MTLVVFPLLRARVLSFGFVLGPLTYFLFLLFLNLGADVHSRTIKLLDIPRKIHNIELIFGSLKKLVDFKHKPVGIPVLIRKDNNRGLV